MPKVTKKERTMAQAGQVVQFQTRNVPRAGKPKRDNEPEYNPELHARLQARLRGNDDNKPDQDLPDDDRIRLTIAEFLTKKNQRIAELHELHEEYNARYFEGRLRKPLITIERLSPRRLADYNHGKNNLELSYHIRFSLAFVALCWNDKYMEHITNTMKHEMIHQWQHEVLYANRDKVPKGWHNKDFKAKAAEIGIPCVGRNMCTGTNLAKIAAEQREGEDFGEGMEPEEKEAVPKKSRNRKWQCGCGDARTVWSTKEVAAVCAHCKLSYMEK